MSIKNELAPSKNAVLVLATGDIFWGYSIGTDGYSVGEVVFNTALTGYQEILTDPSYAQQIITLTVPHVGNVGVNPNDEEAGRIWASGLVVRSLSTMVSNWRARQSLSDYLKAQHIVAISGVDTRQLTHFIRERGAQAGCLMAGNEINVDHAFKLANGFPGLAGKDLTNEVSISGSMPWSEGTLFGSKKQKPASDLHIVVYDCGIKRQILRLLGDEGCRITVVPVGMSARAVLELKPDGLVISNGPGDPAACRGLIQLIQDYIKHDIPMLGVCLGLQLVVLACGGQTVKMKFGHHGANHPVRELQTGRIFITSQNHGFAVDEASLPAQLRVTHRSLFDGTVQGVVHTSKPIIAFQGHPEASPGPQDMSFVFSNFVDLVEKRRTVVRSYA